MFFFWVAILACDLEIPSKIPLEGGTLWTPVEEEGEGTLMESCFQHGSCTFQCLFSSLSLPEPSLSFFDAFYHEFWSFRRALSLTDSRVPFYHDFSQNHKIFSTLFIQFSHLCFYPFFLLLCCLLLSFCFLVALSLSLCFPL